MAYIRVNTNKSLGDSKKKHNGGLITKFKSSI